MKVYMIMNVDGKDYALYVRQANGKYYFSKNADCKAPIVSKTAPDADTFRIFGARI